MDKYKENRKKYNSDKTYVQISKNIHSKMKEYCSNKNLTIRDFLEKIISDNIK